MRIDGKGEFARQMPRLRGFERVELTLSSVDDRGRVRVYGLKLAPLPAAGK